VKTPIKSLGLHKVPVLLYPEIEARIIINVARFAVEAEHQAKGDALKVVEVTSMGDLGLEVGVALGDAEIAARQSVADFLACRVGPRFTHAWFFCPGQHGFCSLVCFPVSGN
jgi:hypothetical protein